MMYTVQLTSQEIATIRRLVEEATESSVFYRDALAALDRAFRPYGETDGIG